MTIYVGLESKNFSLDKQQHDFVMQFGHLRKYSLYSLGFDEFKISLIKVEWRFYRAYYSFVSLMIPEVLPKIPKILVT